MIGQSVNPMSRQREKDRTNVDLSTRDIPLRGTGNVQAYLLNSHEVFTRRNAARNSRSQLTDAFGSKLERIECSPPFRDLIIR